MAKKRFKYDYQGSTPIQVGDKIRVHAADGETGGHVHMPSTNVRVTLAVQFIAGGSFYFYKDEGVTWSRVKDGE